MGSVAFGLFNELDRRGFDVLLEPQYRNMATAHRVGPPPTGGTQVVVASGMWIDRWRSISEAVEIAYYDPRGPAGLDRFDQAKLRVVLALQEAGLDELVALAESNLFGLLLHPAVPPGVGADVATMYELGEPTAVFLAPVGVEPPPA